MITKRRYLVQHKKARERVERQIAELAGDNKYSRGLSAEGYMGGYLAALDDVFCMLTYGGCSSRHHRIWFGDKE